MKSFPYKKEDLISKKDFIKYSIKRNYRINNDFLEFLSENNLLKAIIIDNKEFYSEFQFYLLIDIIDKRYDNYFYRTYFTYSKNCKVFYEEMQKHFDLYDEIYKKNIYPKYVDFFNMYYDIVDDYQDFKKYYEKELYKKAKLNGYSNIKKLHNLGNIEKECIDNIKTKIEPIEKNIEIIDYFVSRYHLKYEKYILIYETIKNNNKFYHIPEFLVVKDFVEKILLVIEWYYKVNKIKYNRKITGMLIGKYSTNCIICGNFFEKKRINQVTCGNKCSKLYKNILKKEKRKINKNYGA